MNASPRSPAAIAATAGSASTSASRRGSATSERCPDGAPGRDRAAPIRSAGCSPGPVATAFGRPLATDEEAGERLSIAEALAVFSSDNLSSVAYATEAIMFTLLAAGTSAFWLTMPISVLIVAVLAIIVVSYRQTIRAYPNGGGSYIVAKDNLGPMAGLVAAAALLVDYVLTVSVSVAAGVAAITSAFPEPSATAASRSPPSASPSSMLVNLRGIRESGTVFAIPTYVFLVSMLALLAIGIGCGRCSATRRRSTGVTPVVVPGRDARPAPADAGVRRRLQRDHRASRPCRTACRRSSRPEAPHARTTLTVMGVLVGDHVPRDCRTWPASTGAVPTDARDGHLADRPRRLRHRRRLLRPPVLDDGHPVLAANTSFADFPRLSSILARDGFMPSRFAFRGERLAFNTGIVALAVARDRRRWSRSAAASRR